MSRPELIPAFQRSDEGRIELKIPASSEWVRVARLTVAGVASRLPFGIDAVEDIKLAVTEAINNAIQHAPVSEDKTALVTIGFEVKPDGLCVLVSDEGRIETELPIQDSTPRLNEHDLPEGGLGLVLIRSLMDEVTHEGGNDCDTVLRMFKKLPADYLPVSGA
jgi:serine/threonine-protein kinase RsbW